jgi:Ca-activated chloride channel family protein
MPAQPTFKGGIRTVAVYATATDGNGRLAPDLTRENFEISDNGKPQPLSIFANEVQPITVVMLLDRSGSMKANFSLVEKAAEEFVLAMKPEDKARIGSFSNRIEIDPRDFTSDRDELLDILRTQLQEEGPTPLWNAVNVGITALLHQQGRRVILVFTDGADRPMTDNPNNNSLKSVMKRAEEEDVMVYSIGLSGMNPPMRGSMPPPVFGRRMPGGWGGRPGGGWGGYGGRMATMDKPDDGLPKIAEATGGGYFELTSADDLASTFKRVADELHHQYVLGFTPAVLDGKMHKLDVRVKGSTATVRARKSYRATVER